MVYRYLLISFRKIIVIILFNLYFKIIFEKKIVINFKDYFYIMLMIYIMLCMK